MTKWPVQKPTHRTTKKHVEHHDVTDIYKKTISTIIVTKDDSILCIKFLKFLNTIKIPM